MLHLMNRLVTRTKTGRMIICAVTAAFIFTSSIGMAQAAPDYASMARKYDAYMAAMDQIARMPIKSREDFEKAKNLANVPLKDLVAGLRAKVIVIATNDPSFKRGVEKRVLEAGKGDRKVGAGILLSTLRSDPKAVMAIPGAAAVSKIAQKTLERDAQRIRAAGDAVKRVVDQNKRAGLDDPAFLAIGETVGGLLVAMSGLLITDVQADGGVTAMLIGALAAAVVVIIAAWGQAKADDFKDNPTTGTSDFENCMTRVENKYRSCLARAGGNWLEQASCWTQNQYDVAGCWLIPQP